MRAHRSHKELSLKSWLSEPALLANAVLVGGPGSGKSTALRFLFLSLQEALLKAGAGEAPIYAHLSDLIRADGSFDALCGLANTQAKSLFLIDGLDEVAPELADTFFKGDLPRLAKLGHFILACRDEVFFREFSDNPVLTRLLSEIYELVPWEVDKHSLPFSREYFTKAGQPHLFDRLGTLFETVPDAKSFARNPFQLSLLIYLAMSGEADLVADIKNRFMLYSAFYAHWIDRESKRTGSEGWRDAVTCAHTDLAFEYYTRRSTNPKFSELDAWRTVGSKILSSTVFRDLFVSRLDPIRYEPYIAGFRHESLVEFLIAGRLVETLRSSLQLAAGLLDVEYNYEINSFVRDAFAVCDANQRMQMERNLEQLYQTLLAQLPSRSGAAQGPAVAMVDQVRIGAESNLRIREQAIYFLGRLGMSVCPPVLEKAFREDEEPIIRRAAALGATLYGHTEIERAYMALLRPGNEEDLLNRSVQLIYFGDATGSLHEFRDAGHTRWDKCKRAILLRLSGTSERDIRLRWWDLLTLQSFLGSRGERLSGAECAIVRASGELPGESEPRREQIGAIAAVVVEAFGELV
jgi:hypothetical protein